MDLSANVMIKWSMVASYAAGLHGMTRNLALEMKPIRVNLVSPGAVDTELWKWMTKEQKKEYVKTTGEHVMTGRIGRREFSAISFSFFFGFGWLFNHERCNWIEADVM